MKRYERFILKIQTTTRLESRGSGGKLNNDDLWIYKSNYLDDCIREDETADLVYLRSGDQERAIGVITNRRANYYTLGEGECSADTTIAAPLHSKHGEENLLGNLIWDKYSDSLRTYGNVYPDGGNQRLRIRNMALGFLGAPKKYKIKYYSPYDHVNSIKEETRWAPQLTLEFPEMDTLDIVLFEVFPNGENFKSAEGDTSLTDREKAKLPKNEMQEPEVLVYPNPNKGNFKVLIENPYETKAIYLTDNIGKRIDSRLHVEKYNIFNMKYPKPGVYFLVVVFQDKVIRRKIIIN